MYQIIKKGDKYCVREKGWIFWHYFGYDGYSWWPDHTCWGSYNAAKDTVARFEAQDAERRKFKAAPVEIIE